MPDSLRHSSPLLELQGDRLRQEMPQLLADGRLRQEMPQLQADDNDDRHQSPPSPPIAIGEKRADVPARQQPQQAARAKVTPRVGRSKARGGAEAATAGAESATASRRAVKSAEPNTAAPAADHPAPKSAKLTPPQLTTVAGSAAQQARSVPAAARSARPATRSGTPKAAARAAAQPASKKKATPARDAKQLSAAGGSAEGGTGGRSDSEPPLRVRASGLAVARTAATVAQAEVPTTKAGQAIVRQTTTETRVVASEVHVATGGPPGSAAAGADSSDLSCVMRACCMSSKARFGR